MKRSFGKDNIKTDLEETGVKAWNGFIAQERVTCWGSCEYDMGTLDFIKLGFFFTS